MARFSSNDDEILIEEIRKYPSLYNYEDANYKNFVIKENGWKNVAASLGKNVDDCKKRWRSVKDNYFRNKKKQKLGTGSSSLDKPIKWALYNQLSFLDKIKHDRSDFENVVSNKSILDDPDSDVHLNPATPSTSMSSTKITNTNSVEDWESLSGSRCSTPTLKSKVKRSQTRGLNTSSIAEFNARAQRRMELLEAIHNKTQRTETEDDVDLFMKSISYTVKKLPPAQITEAKIGILTLVSNLQTKAIQTSESPFGKSFPPFQPYNSTFLTRETLVRNKCLAQVLIHCNKPQDPLNQILTSPLVHPYQFQFLLVNNIMQLLSH
ncbi:hypothetical protein ABEB36_014715 [Hypothenemus hampei]|uniref:MADF domain-containing protein n=1 Tax=Hypothenemus hampei TaxID=57062 RepID=A0ABD1E5E0_HYPHA